MSGTPEELAHNNSAAEHKKKKLEEEMKDIALKYCLQVLHPDRFDVVAAALVGGSDIPMLPEGTCTATAPEVMNGKLAWKGKCLRCGHAIDEHVLAPASPAKAVAVAAAMQPETAEFQQNPANKRWLTHSCSESPVSVSILSVAQECSFVASAGSCGGTVGDGKSPTISASDSGGSPPTPIPVVPLSQTQMKQMQLNGLVSVELPSAPPPYVDHRNATKQQGSSNCSNAAPNSSNIHNDCRRSNLTTVVEGNINVSTDISRIRTAINSMFNDMQHSTEFSDNSKPSANFIETGVNGTANRPNNTAVNLKLAVQKALRSLAAEPTDRHIRNRIKTMSASNSRVLSQHIVRDPSLMRHHFTADRGSIVASLIERHGDTDGMVLYVMSNFASLVREKGGCIAVLRILQHVSPADRAAAFAQLRALPDVATHQYSNFVLQYFVEGGQNENGLGTEGIPVQPTAADVCHELIHRELSDAQTLRTWSSSKCGSQVVDRVIRNARKADAHVFFAKIFSDANLVLYLGAHEFGHFNLKTAFELMVENAQDEPELLRKYYDIAEPLLRDGRYSRWVFRRAKTSLVLLRPFSQIMVS